MAVNDFLIDLKRKEIDFDKYFKVSSHYLTDGQFIKILDKIDYRTTEEGLENLKKAFRDDKAKDKISIDRMKQRFNTIDPSYLNKTAVKSGTDAKLRLNHLPEKIRKDIIAIDNYFRRKNIDVRECFKLMDKNKDGTISEQEFCKVLMKEHKISGFHRDDLIEIYKALDINKDNSVTIGEFMYFIEGAVRSKEDMARQMSDDVKEQLIGEIKNLFEEFDTQRKGYIEEADLYKILKSAGVYVDRNACSAIIREHDTNGDGRLSYREFEKVMLDKMVTDIVEDEVALKDLNAMFYQADINKDGYLSVDELDIMFKQNNANITYQELLSFMKEIDVDEDGRLDIDEFIALMTMDQSSFKDKKSSNTMLKMRKASRQPAANFARYFKIMPNHFIESFTTRLWKKKMNLPSSVFEPKINPETLLYKDLRQDMEPKDENDNPILGIYQNFYLS